MPESFSQRLDQIHPLCRALAGEEAWQRIASDLADVPQEPDLEAYLRSEDTPKGLPLFVADLAWLEQARALAADTPLPGTVDQIQVNPSLFLKQVDWLGLETIATSGDTRLTPQSGEAWLMVWRAPASGEVGIAQADDADLLALKLVAEELDPTELAGQGEISLAAIQAARDRAVRKGLLLAPRSKIIRIAPQNTGQADQDPEFLEVEVFTLQWHLTQKCDLNCKHCYDRSDRPDMTLGAAMGVLEDFQSFCQERNVRGQVTFTGGNPLLYPYFDEIYTAAAEQGFQLAILGNPTPRARMDSLLAIAKPCYFQVSLEGLAKHNDEIRGRGHFVRTTKFLALLDKLGIGSQVMLTLTSENMDQVIELGRMLRGKTGQFNFNRLALVGEGAALALPTPEDYARFLADYLDAAHETPTLMLKDSLLNILRRERGEPLFGGCTGFGCGAAFNFLSLLSDGEVHACRKFPSLLGNAFEQSLSDIYDSALASQYRAGPRECDGCQIRAVCGGCLAISHSLGLDIFSDRDPFCFID